MKKLLLTLALGALAATATYAADFFMIGSNVNGKSWSLNQEDCKFTATSNPNIYEWNGTVLGTGFKINDGTWGNNDINFGSNGKPLEVGVAYTMNVGGSTGNIGIAGVSEIENPKVVLDVTDLKKPVITVTGQEGGEIMWYVAGINGNFVVSDDYGAIVLWETETEGIYETEPFEVTVGTGEFKIASTGWATEYGLNEPVTISNSNMKATLEEVFGEAGNLPYELELGFYQVSFNFNTLEMVFTKTDGDVDFTAWYVNIIGPFNTWTDNGVNPDADGVSVHEGLPINAEGFKVKVYPGYGDGTYYITAEDSPIAVDTEVALVVDAYNGHCITIQGASDETSYDVQYNVTNNKVMVKLAAGVNDVTVGNNAPVVYYNLQGVRVANPAAGQLVIRQQGNDVTKVLVK